jgi:glycosyltransferase involved in cell wall biosynthesis
MPDPTAQPVFAFLAFTSGSFEGAIVRDMRLANDLHRRGYKVVVYWGMESNRELVDKSIRQRVLCRGSRYMFKRPSGLFEKLSTPAFWFSPNQRREFMQRNPGFVDRLTENFVRNISCTGGHSDMPLVRKLLKFMRADGVTHLLPTFAMVCPIALSAKQLHSHDFEYLVTFQGEEIFANYAQRIGKLEDYHQRLREAMNGSPWPAVAVSDDYIRRLNDEMGLDASKMRTIYPGIELPKTNEPPPFEVLKPKFPHLTRDLPIVTYIGRQDSEKGIDLLLYATRMLIEKGIRLQLVVCGGTTFGQRYRDVVKHIAEHLRLPIHHRRRIPQAMRDALYSYSRCIVYPSIHREPFGMVAAECMSQGTPVLVPDSGGITEAIRWDGKEGGLTFKSWDTADLARQLERLLVDEPLYQQLKNNTRSIASNFTTERMTDAVLAHLGLPQRAGAAPAATELSAAATA